MANKPCSKADLDRINESAFARRGVGCLVLSREGQIVLQLRDADCQTYPGCLATFGGGIEAGESPMQALVRELKEELGADVNAGDVVTLGAMQEEEHNELVYLYFWQDKRGSITGCYEGKAKYYNDPIAPRRHPRVMNDVKWLLRECKRKGLLK